MPLCLRETVRMMKENAEKPFSPDKYGQILTKFGKVFISNKTLKLIGKWVKNCLAGDLMTKELA